MKFSHESGPTAVEQYLARDFLLPAPASAAAVGWLGSSFRFELAKEVCGDGLEDVIAGYFIPHVELHYLPPSINDGYEEAESCESLFLERARNGVAHPNIGSPSDLHAAEGRPVERETSGAHQKP